MDVPAYLKAYRAQVDLALGILRITAAATRTGLVAHGVLAGRVHAALDRLDSQIDTLAREDDQAAAILAREALAIESLLNRFRVQHKRAVKTQSQTRGKRRGANRK